MRVDLDEKIRAAAARDDVATARQLLADGANPYAADAEGRTTFNHAASNGLRVLALLVEEAFRDTQKQKENRRWKNYGLNMPSGYYGSTLVTYAAKVSPAALVAEMTKAGADIAIVNGSGWTLLHCVAVMPGRTEVLKILIQAFRDQGHEDLIGARSTHVYETDYGGRKVVYGAGLTAAGLCRARMDQDPGHPPELAGYINILEI